MTTVTDADKAATAAYYDRATDILALAPCPPGVTLVSIMDEAFARHREAAEARARLEGAEVMREAAARVIRSGMHNEYARPQPALTAAVLAIDPAAILSEHARRKAMDELIAGDADLYDGPPVG